MHRIDDALPMTPSREIGDNFVIHSGWRSAYPLDVLVPGAGFEPACLAAERFKRSVSRQFHHPGNRYWSERLIFLPLYVAVYA